MTSVATAQIWKGHHNPTSSSPSGHKRRVPITPSPRSKLLKLPSITSVPHSKTDLNTAGARASTANTNDSRGSSGETANPFHMPSDVEVFALREDERRQKQEAKAQMRKLHIYEKSMVKRKNFKELLAEEEDDIAFYERLKKRDSDKVLTNRQARVDRHFGKENLHDFIAKKREMFLVQYALGVKREEMRKLEEIAQAEEQKLLDDEKALEEDAAKFDAFLKENDKNSVEAIKKAEQETKAKLEKIQEIKKLNMQIMSIRSDMSKNEDQLKDLQRYKEFLDKVTPREWFEEHKEGAKELKTSTSTDGRDDDGSVASNSKPRRTKSTRSKHAPTKPHSKPSADPDSDSDITAADDDEAQQPQQQQQQQQSSTDTADDEPSLYFKTPQQLLDIFAELEENNLALIQNCQETEETLEELKQKIVDTEARMDQETQSLKQQIDFLNAAIGREEHKAQMLEERAKMFSSGTMGGESQEKLLEELHQKVKEVYRRCIGDNEATFSTLTMLTAIENRLESLFETIEMMPPDKVEQAEKMKDKERRQRLREEKMEAQRLLQEERVQRALERARAPVIKKTGKPIAFRSAPPQKKKRKEEDTKKKEEEDLEYYGLLALP
ncbi:uncharacterized protein EV422DRAFT_17462 [Fimicolochytrium jonesii]|uniref:uncharacterized protein n=1 Tax=Fimicolochytrium jonesii TaxID=1396493 RepID=UPI0022FEC1A0|nr:uncharacterized protein EV422DRAFT_17462 [Fimicolochytrium jonesii]KAI8826926.1 hypothetical protein EV422DRAFT_17462 [Fimicolochytrium jonesii]